MEKRNFTTPLRTVEAANFSETLVDEAVSMFGSSKKLSKRASDTSYIKKACAEDERTDSL